MREKFCKFCGLELENNSCNCEGFLSSKKNKDSKRSILICDSCGRKVNNAVKFCPFCGIPFVTTKNKENEELKKELRGEYAIDVLEFYKGQICSKNKEKIFLMSKKVIITITTIIFILCIFIFINVIYPIIIKKINEKNTKELIESGSEEIIATEVIETQNEIKSIIEETKMSEIKIYDKWIKQDGFCYCFDKEGNPVVDDWVEEIDEYGNVKKYYFDLDGKLVVNSWIDGEYYVGADGAMYVNSLTPDGAYVDSQGKVIINNEEYVEKVAVERETYVYYESPDETSETKVVSNQKSATAGIIKGVEEDKTYELYIKKLMQVRNSVKYGDLKCNIIFYYPIIAGAKEKEVDNINNCIVEKFTGEFYEFLERKVENFNDLPKSITLNTVEQRTINQNRFMFLVYGRVTPRKGLYEYVKFRFTYDRKSKTLAMQEIPYK